MPINPLPTRIIESTVKTATNRWHSKERPDTFRTNVATKDPAHSQTLSVRINHRESFPQGGRTFTLDIRSVPDTKKTPGTLIHRDRIRLAAGQ